MNKVVYILGAGFSAPLGLPVMSNFYEKSRDMFEENPVKYAHFKEIFDTFQTLSIVKNFYEADLFNIEEILSLLEMREYVSRNEKEEERFQKYIFDVIEYCTPELKVVEHFGEVPIRKDIIENHILGGTGWANYAFFVASLFGLTSIAYQEVYGPVLVFINQNNKQTRYSIITLNYDMVLEMVAQRIQIYKSKKSTMAPKTITFSDDPDDSSVPLAKLHGSLGSSTIVPPTWRKNSNEAIVPAWSTAAKLLSEANYIRILGYSLPPTDSHIPYFLKSASVDSTHLKGIDVICLDPDGSVKKRFDSMIHFKHYRFKNGRTENYLNANFNEVKEVETNNGSIVLQFDKLEHVHELYMKS